MLSSFTKHAPIKLTKFNSKSCTKQLEISVWCILKLVLQISEKRWNMLRLSGGLSVPILKTRVTTFYDLVQFCLVFWIILLRDFKPLFISFVGEDNSGSCWGMNWRIGALLFQEMELQVKNCSKEQYTWAFLIAAFNINIFNFLSYPCLRKILIYIFFKMLS